MAEVPAEGVGGDIMVLELDEKEKVTLKHALEVVADELKTERLKTDDREVRASIHEEEETVQMILKKVA